MLTVEQQRRANADRFAQEVATAAAGHRETAMKRAALMREREAIDGAIASLGPRRVSPAARRQMTWAAFKKTAMYRDLEAAYKAAPKDPDYLTAARRKALVDAELEGQRTDAKEIA